MSDAKFLNLICPESGAGLLLDVENVYLNATNHRFDPYAFIDALRPDLHRRRRPTTGAKASKSYTGHLIHVFLYVCIAAGEPSRGYLGWGHPVSTERQGRCGLGISY
jgi:hypothetical protein